MLNMHVVATDKMMSQYLGFTGVVGHCQVFMLTK